MIMAVKGAEHFHEESKGPHMVQKCHVENAKAWDVF